MWGWAIASVAISAGGTWLARVYALRRRLIDEPGERRSHDVATPRGGGVGPVLAICLVLAGYGALVGLPGADWRWLVAALVAVAGIGAWDDHRPLGAGIRLAVHAVAGCMVACGFGLQEASPLAFMAVAAAVPVFVNVWNFMDGINGIASTQAAMVIGTATMLVFDPWRAPVAAMALAVVAFVPFNFPRARIFLGDVGSGPLGLGIVIAGGALHVSASSWVMPLLLLFPCAAFLVDSSLTLARRMAEGEQWWTPHTRHLYQAMARLWGHAPVTLAYAAWSGIGVGVLMAVGNMGSTVIMASLALWYMATALAWAGLQRHIAYRSGTA